MATIHVKVTGPGRVFDPEFEAIRLALEGIGCKVEVKNEYPVEHPTRGSDVQPWDVELEAVHCPWGG